VPHKFIKKKETARTYDTRALLNTEQPLYVGVDQLKLVKVASDHARGSRPQKSTTKCRVNNEKFSSAEKSASMRETRVLSLIELNLRYA